MSRRGKAGFLVLSAAGCLGLLLAGRVWLAASLGLALVLWLLQETRRRQAAYFGGGDLEERSAWLEPPALGLQALSGCNLLMLHHAGGQLSLFDLERMRTLWRRGFDEAPLAALALSDGRLLWAGETCLHLSDAQGVDRVRLAFDAPLLRQAYRLSLSADGSRVLLCCPWLALVAEAGLGAWRGSVRWEDAGHYLKYGALAPDGGGLLLGGALLLDEEQSGGAALEARWDLWRPAVNPNGPWVKVWGQSAESYSNTHLRALSWSAADLLAVELVSQGGEFRLLGAEGGERRRRRGEHPVASPDRSLWAFQTEAGLHVEDLAGVQRWRWAHQERLRGLRLADDGSAVVLEGMHLRGLDSQGRLRWTRRWRRDPLQVALLPQWVVALDGQRLARLRLPLRSA